VIRLRVKSSGSFVTIFSVKFHWTHSEDCLSTIGRRYGLVKARYGPKVLVTFLVA